MKILILTALTLVGLTQAHAQIILGSFYDTAQSTTINTVAQFTAAGVKGPGGAALSVSDTVTGFDFTPAGQSSYVGSNTYTSNGLTLTPGSNYFSSGSGIYQSDIFGNTDKLTGLTLALTPYTKYTLDLFSNPIFGGSQDVTFAYGTQGSTDTGIAGNSVVAFNFTTGAVPIDTITFATENPSSGYGGITGFAIVGQGQIPEPSTYALLGLGMLGLLFVGRRKKA